MPRYYCGLFIVILSLCLTSGLRSAPFGIRSFTTNGVLSWTNAVVPGVCTIESAYDLDGVWLPARNSFATNGSSSTSVALPSDRGFYRVRAVDVSGTPEGFTNLVNSYGLLETIAGNGTGQTDGISYWQSSFEDGPAQWAALSRPHFAQADRGGIL